MGKDKKDMEEIINVPPLSVNKVWQGRRFKTKLYKDWEKDALKSMPKREMIMGDILVRLFFYMRYPKKADIDNPIKMALDLLTKRGWIEDDRKIFVLNVYKIKSKEEKIKVEIFQL